MDHMESKNLNSFILPAFLVAIGLISSLGFNLFGAALLEGAAWKQNVIYCILIIFCILPPAVHEMKATWMVAGYAIAFFMFGGANMIGTVGIVLGLAKICLVALILLQTYRVYLVAWKRAKFTIAFPVIAIICAFLLLPIQDENIVGSSFRALSQWSWDRFSSDKEFHLFLGLSAIFSGITEFIILKYSVPNYDYTPTDMPRVSDNGAKI